MYIYRHMYTCINNMLMHIQYIYIYSKIHSKIDKIFWTLPTHPSSRSRFLLIILEERFRCKSQGTEIEDELLRTQSGI